MLVGVTIPPEHGRGHREVPRRAGAAGRHRRRRRGRPRRTSAARPPTRPPTSARARPRSCARSRSSTDCDTVVFDNELTPGPAVQPREAARPHRHRPHRGDPRHLRPERPQPGGQGPGRAGPAALPAAPAAGPGPARCRSRPAACRRRAAPASAPAVPARPSSRSTGGASCVASTSSRPTSARSTGTGRPSARPQRRGPARQGRHRRLHERRQVDAAQPAHRRRRAGRGPPVRHARRHHPPPRAARRRAGAAHRHGRLHPQAAPPARRGVPVDARRGGRRRPARPRGRRQSPPTSAATCGAVRDVLAEIGADHVPELLAFNKADLAPDEAERLRRPRTRARWRLSAVTGEGSTLLVRTIGDRLRSLTTVVELVIPFERGDLLAAVHRAGEVLDEEPGEGGMRVRGRFDDAVGRPLPRVRGRRERGRRRAASSRRRTPTTASTCCARRPRSCPAACVDLSIGTPCDPPPAAVVDGAGVVGRRAGLPAVGRHAGLPRGGRRLAGPALRRRRSTPQHLAACIGTKEFVAGVPHWLRLRTPDRDTVLYPRDQLPVLRHGRHARRLPRRSPYATLDDDRRRPTPSGRCACGSTRRATPPASSTTWPRPRPGAASTASRCSPTSATSSSPGTGPGRTILERGPRRRARRPLAVEAVEPRRRPGRLLRRRPRARPLPVRGAQARRLHGARARCRRRPSPPSATTPTSTSSATATSAGSTLHGRCARRRRASSARCPTGRSTCGRRRPAATPGRWPAGWRPRAAPSWRPGEFYGEAGADHVRIAVVQPDDKIGLVAERLAGGRTDWPDAAAPGSAMPPPSRALPSAPDVRRSRRAGGPSSPGVAVGGIVVVVAVSARRLRPRPGRRLRTCRSLPATLEVEISDAGGYSIYHEYDGADRRLPCRAPTSTVTGPSGGRRAPVDTYDTDVSPTPSAATRASAPTRSTPTKPGTYTVDASDAVRRAVRRRHRRRARASAAGSSSSVVGRPGAHRPWA